MKLLTQSILSSVICQQGARSDISTADHSPMKTAIQLGFMTTGSTTDRYVLPYAIK